MVTERVNALAAQLPLSTRAIIARVLTKFMREAGEDPAAVNLDRRVRNWVSEAERHHTQAASESTDPETIIRVMNARVIEMAYAC